MKTYKVWTSSSGGGFNPLHTFKAAGFTLKDGVYLFHDEAFEPLHAISAAPGLFVTTTG